MAQQGIYVVGVQRQTISTAITVLQIKAGSTSPLELIRAHMTERGSTTAAQEAIQIVRKTVAAQMTNSFTPLKLFAGDSAANAPSSSTGCGTIAVSEGTDGDVLVEEGFDVRTGWLWVPTPDDRIYVSAGGIIGLKFPIAPASQSWSGAMYFREYK